jgi:hypothetical protein
VIPVIPIPGAVSSGASDSHRKCFVPVPDPVADGRSGSVRAAGVKTPFGWCCG